MYNPSDVGKKGSLFGFPYSVVESDLVIVPVELDVTTSYGDGTKNAPKRILEESSQLDLSIPGVRDPWKLKSALGDSLKSVGGNESARVKAKKVMDLLEGDNEPDDQLVSEVNQFCASVHQELEANCMRLLAGGKIVGVLGGDHSSPLGLINALAARQSFGILQIDAHMDLRDSYEGFEYSHASIMYNAIQVEGVQSLTQVGVRDYCEEEELFIQHSTKGIHTFFDEVMYNERLNGSSWSVQVSEIVNTLPESVYISFDVDGLDSSLCPNTGTPVPGGLQFNEAMYLLREVVSSGRKIIGFDLSEVGDDSWDANVGARLLYRLCALAGVSNGWLQLK